MKRLLYLPLALGLLTLSLIGCDAFSPDESSTGGVVTLSGQVLNAQTNNPVPNAFVRVLPQDLLFETDENGQYLFDVTIDSTMNLELVASKDGFALSKVTVLGLASRVIDVPTLRIGQTVAEEPESGKASNILLLGQSSQSIGVKESGSEEVAQITFQVADSAGMPVIINKQARVNFSFGAQPNGGEFIFPTEATTDNNGRVTVNVSSGFRAGVIQLVAETEVDGHQIRSLPVAIAIHGGHPDQDHFSIGPARFNFPGLNAFGLTNSINVIAGDEYANPVKPGTAVYFTSNYGVISGSILTGDEGGGSVNLISANPLPPDGIALITARTADKNQADVIGQTPVVFSGVPAVGISPSTAILGQTYTLSVTDQNGNPLSAGTNITVRVEGTKVKAVGNTGVTLDDTAFIGGFGYEHVLRGPGITTFTFRAVEDLTLDETGTPTVESITIKISGPNGAVEIVLTASGSAPFTRTEGAIVEQIGDEFRVRLAP